MWHPIFGCAAATLKVDATVCRTSGAARVRGIGTTLPAGILPKQCTALRHSHPYPALQLELYGPFNTSDVSEGTESILLMY